MLILTFPGQKPWTYRTRWTKGDSSFRHTN